MADVAQVAASLAQATPPDRLVFPSLHTAPIRSQRARHLEPPHRRPVRWLATAGASMLALVGVALGVVLWSGRSAGQRAPGSSPSGSTTPHGSVPTAIGPLLVPVTPTSFSTASGEGSGTSGPTRLANVWALTYQVTCSSRAMTTATFTVLSATGTLARIDVAVDGGASGARTGLPPTTVAVHVDVAPDCSWTVTDSVTVPVA